MKKIRKELIIGIVITVIGGIILFIILKPFEGNEPVVIEKEAKISSPLKAIKDITLNTPLEYIREKLGAPHKIQKFEKEKELIYHFEEFSLKIATNDDETITSLTYYLKNMRKRIEIISGIVLGKDTFGDYKNATSKIFYSISSKDGWLFSDCYFGNPGCYWYYRIGNYNDFESIITPDLRVENNTVEKSQVANVKLNFISIARDTIDLGMFWFEDFR